MTSFRYRACPGLLMATNSVYYLRIPIAFTWVHIATEAHRHSSTYDGTSDARAARLNRGRQDEHVHTDTHASHVASCIGGREEPPGSAVLYAQTGSLCRAQRSGPQLRSDCRPARASTGAADEAACQPARRCPRAGGGPGSRHGAAYARR